MHKPNFLTGPNGLRSTLTDPARVREAVTRIDWSAPDIGLAELGRAFKVSYQSAREWRLLGYLPPAYTHGGRVRWAAQDMKDFLESLLTAEPRVTKGGGR